jgi:hypothetical protein
MEIGKNCGIDSVSHSSLYLESLPYDKKYSTSNKKIKKKPIGAAEDRFSILSRFDPDLSIPNHMQLQHFWLGLSKESALQLDIAVEWLFTHKTTAEGEALLDRI